MKKLLIILSTMMPIAIFGSPGCDGVNCSSAMDEIEISVDCTVDSKGNIFAEEDIDSFCLNCVRDEMVVLFNGLSDYVKEQISDIDLEIKRLEGIYPLDKAEIECLKGRKAGHLQRFEVMNLIAKRNVDGLRKIDPAIFNYDFGISADGNKFENNFGGRLVSHRIGGDNMLSCVLFHSATNKTEEDNEKTLEMLKIMLDKGVDVNSSAGRVYWIKDKLEDKNSLSSDYGADFRLVEVAILYSFPQAVELLLQHGAKFIKGNALFYVHHRALSDFLNDDIKNGASKEELKRFTKMFLIYLEVLDFLMNEIPMGRGGKDTISIFDSMFCKYAAHNLY